MFGRPSFFLLEESIRSKVHGSISHTLSGRDVGLGFFPLLTSFCLFFCEDAVSGKVSIERAVHVSSGAYAFLRQSAKRALD